MNAWSATESLINSMASAGTPFLFSFDFGGEESFALPLSQIDPAIMRYQMAGFSNQPAPQPERRTDIRFLRNQLSLSLYQAAFEKVMYHLRRGDSYLLNLTFPVGIETNLSCLQIFEHANAPYKLWLKDRFVVFSPESFITIEGNNIHTYPMKGTISANIPDAGRLLMENRKELAEHYTIVDLLRNDLSMVAGNVRVERFRYLEPIHTLNGTLLQTSTHISGTLPSGWRSNLGTLLVRLLPAGSISGAPKRRTVEIIRQAELDNRGFYTGVMGVFDGSRLYSAVMIRFVEQRSGQLFFRAGGGITVNSRCEEEYNELLQKVALPFGPMHAGQ
ncbi:MAG TPA: aminodeoxychorismate synthase component I [Bacteroidales bacterium]|nr:aminodeoxychorismate synthase component I [Bacteroidales bacterium]